MNVFERFSRIKSLSTHFCQMSSPHISNLIVTQWENVQTTIQSQTLHSIQNDKNSMKTTGWATDHLPCWENMGMTVLGFTCAKCAAPTSPIELNARLSNTRFLLADLAVDRAEPIRRAPSSPIRLLRSDRWVRLDDQREIVGIGLMNIWIGQAYVCVFVLNSSADQVL